jgi:hypothetical protein
MAPNVKEYHPYFRFLETEDEYFNYGTGPYPSSGRWQIYGVDLGDDVLEKIYHINAERVILHEGIIK